MERTLLETIQSLGLDVQFAIILLMFVLDGVATQGGRIAAWYAAQPQRVLRRTAASRPSAEADVRAWSPNSLAETGSTAA